MRDVAALAGVSLKTVSRVVNGAPTVDANLAARVRRAAAQLNYRHNMTASNLRRGDRRSFMIGLMLEDVGNPYSSIIYRAVEDAARERGVGVLAGSLDEDPARERELAATLVARRVDGLIVVPAGATTATCGTSRRSAPPWYSWTGRPSLLPADSVLADNARGRDDRRPAPDRPRSPAHRLPGRPGLHRHRPGPATPGTWTRCARPACPPTRRSSVATCAPPRPPGTRPPGC